MAVYRSFSQFLRSNLAKRYFPIPRCDFCSNKEPSESDEINSSKIKHKIFQDEDSPIILDVAEERLLYQQEKLKTDEHPELMQIDYKRGVTGVFDVEELVDLLKKDNAQDIIAIKVPEELKYVDYLVIVTGRSYRHILGLAEYIRYVFKKKRHSSDIIPKIEGEKSDWIAMDLGNIALHCMSKAAREEYDLESLWCLGAKFDTKMQKEDDSILQLLKKHSILLDDIKPLKAG